MLRPISCIALAALLAGCATGPAAPIEAPALRMPIQAHVTTDPRALLADGEPTRYDWNLRQIQIGGYRVQSEPGVRTVVAIMDTGVDNNQPKLAGRAYGMLDVVGHDVYQQNGHDVDFTGKDGNGHGTHVAGLVAEVAAGFNVEVLPIKVIPNSGVGDDKLLADGIEKAMAWRDPADPSVRVRVMNLSVSSPRKSDRLEAIIKRATDAGILVVAASGNEGKGVDFPATMPEVLAVGATTVVDEIAGYSCYGSAVDMAAPGGSDDMPIYSTWPTYLTSSDYDAGLERVHTRAGLVGTSMAAPHVAGMAAVAWALHPSMTQRQIRSLLLAMADDHGTPGPDTFYGFGRLNFARVLGGTTHDAH
ncbi:MAG: peptidase and in, kexin, sedolisin [Cyanobacteria bacterium RYN_339]|nr:peptidase and in, kexin, sedolisin [Cyanobacteria bacterium RYN_339]